MMKYIFLATSITSTFLFSSVVHAFDMNGTWSCRLGWTWITTPVKVSGYKQTWEKGCAIVDTVKVGDKFFSKIRQRPCGLPGDTPHVVFSETKDKRIKIEFHQTSESWGYRNEGVAVVIETKTFSEKEGTEWESDWRYCEKKY